MTPTPSRKLLALPVLLMPSLLAPGAASAQDGPSFNCRYASTRTEEAICASPELARIEREMVRSYEQLVGVIGQREARALADELLARRQACEGDPNCIAERLLISMEVFDERAGVVGQPPVAVSEASPDVAPAAIPEAADDGRPEFARLEDLLRDVPERPATAAAEPPPLPRVTAPELPPVAEAEPVAPDSDLPLAAQAPWPDEATAEAAPEDAPADLDLSDALDDATLASSDGAPAAAAPGGDPDAQAGFDTPLSWAFMDLERADRQALQDRLLAAGLLEGTATGAWTNATLAALQTVAETEEGFDVTTQEGAALLLDYLASEAFAEAQGIEVAETSAPAAAPAADVDAGDPLAGVDW